MRSQISLRALSQLAMKSLVMGIEVRYQPLRERRPGQTLGDNKGIAAERFKEFAQHLGLLGMLRHSLHLSLQLLRTKWLLPVILQRFGVAQIVFDFLFQLHRRHHFIERRFWIGALFWPNAVTPVNFFNRSLISDTISESQHCALLRRLRGRAEGSQPRRQIRRSVG